MGDNPATIPADWISEKMWGEVCRATALNTSWSGFYEHISQNIDEWRRIYDSQDPAKEPLPTPWHTK